VINRGDLENEVRKPPRRAEKQRWIAHEPSMVGRNAFLSSTRGGLELD
jgi:hypothetical protein